MTTPLEPVKGSWDVEITRVAGAHSQEEETKVAEFAKELSTQVNAFDPGEETEIPSSITVITLRRI